MLDMLREFMLETSDMIVDRQAERRIIPGILTAVCIYLVWQILILWRTRDES